MTDTTLLGPWVRRFLLEHLAGERNLARNTQLSYRDTLRLLLPFVADQCRQPVDRLTVEEVSANRVRRFLQHVEESRRCAITTRNQRLAAIRALAHFVAQHSPEHIAWCGEIRSIPFKKATQAVVPYLEKSEMDALLASPDRNTTQGRRDYALVLFLYNSGARASEATHLTVADLHLVPSPSVKILGKGNKVRHCPLWPVTARTLAAMVAEREPTQRVFLNRCGQPITRFGIHTLVERCALKATAQMPSLARKRVSPHTVRHTSAAHLLRAGVDINTIRAWLGHVSLDTTNIYAEIDLEMKAEALAKCEITESRQPRKCWTEDRNLMAFLQSL
ncbi:MAG: tyrosine-type recombinase/integrase [Gammaproteobacteria bacterium]